jgi:hypothetical protein
LILLVDERREYRPAAAGKLRQPYPNHLFEGFVRIAKRQS